MTPVLVFDIETVPDIEGLRRLHGLEHSLSDADVAEFAYARRRIQSGNDFLAPHLHRVVSIACALRDSEQFKIWSLGTESDNEAELISRFFDGIERYTPQVISWNGSGFDFPVLHYRGLVHGIAAARYWDMGDEDREFKFNNYLNRYHTRHLDLMDLLALYNGRNYVPLDEMAQLIGLPGKLGMDGSRVWSAYMNGDLSSIRNYCETDVANTYLIFLRFQLMRGHLDEKRYKSEIQIVRDSLGKSSASHWKEFLAAWPEGAAQV